MANSPVLTIHTDGASRGNPGEAAFAYVIETRNAKPIEEAGCLGKMTNNQAEYTALIRALERARQLGTHHHLRIHSDSELMVKQMKGEYRVKDADLQDLYREAQALAKQFPEGVQLVHVRRGQNKRADGLCNVALDGQAKRSRTGHAKIAAPAKRAADDPATPLPAPDKPTRSVSEEALACLREAEEAWRSGQEVPEVETVWRWLVEILARHGVTALGSSPSGK